MPDTSNNTWERYSLLVLDKLEKHDKAIEDFGKIITDILGDIKLLKYQASVLGAGSAAVVTIIIQIIKYLETTKAAASTLTSLLGGG